MLVSESRMWHLLTTRDLTVTTLCTQRTISPRCDIADTMSLLTSPLSRLVYWTTAIVVSFRTWHVLLLFLSLQKANNLDPKHIELTVVIFIRAEFATFIFVITV